jgi:hypothetical protein
MLLQSFKSYGSERSTTSWQAIHLVKWTELPRHDPVLHALSSSASDHCPLLLQPQEYNSTPPIFRFEARCVLMPRFLECVQEAWIRPIHSPQNAMMLLHIKLTRTAKALAICARKLIPQGKIAASICREAIAQLESAQEHKELSEEVLLLCKLLKNRILGLAAIGRSRAP